MFTIRIINKMINLINISISGLPSLIPQNKVVQRCNCLYRTLWLNLGLGLDPATSILLSEEFRRTGTFCTLWLNRKASPINLVQSFFLLTALILRRQYKKLAHMPHAFEVLTWCKSDFMSNGKWLNTFSQVYHICLLKLLLLFYFGFFFPLKCCIFALAVRELTKVQHCCVVCTQHLLNQMNSFTSRSNSNYITMKLFASVI